MGQEGSCGACGALAKLSCLTGGCAEQDTNNNFTSLFGREPKRVLVRPSTTTPTLKQFDRALRWHARGKKTF